MNDTAQILINAQALIRKPNNWVKGYDALPDPLDGFGGHSVNPNSKQAKRFCASGALKRAAGHNGLTDDYYGNAAYHDVKDAVDRAAIELRLAKPYDTIVNVNDRVTTTHDDILRVFDRAINNELGK